MSCLPQHLTYIGVYSDMIEFAQAKHYIANKEELRDMQCGICYQIDADMLRCRGSCKKVFCVHCITRSKSKNNSCPWRCSKIFQVEKIPHLQISFNCPYDPLQCSESITDSSKFRSHLRTCEYISPLMSQQIAKADAFQCSNSHKLLFLNEETFYKIYKTNSFYATTMNQICSLCKSQTICTSICPSCSSEDKKVVFCITCRPLPCTKSMCPIGHLYSKIEVKSNSSVCDFCGVNISIFGSVSYRDQLCNFDVCENCHKELLEVHPLVPLQNQEYGESSEESQPYSSQPEISQEADGEVFSDSDHSVAHQADVAYIDSIHDISFPEEQPQISLQEQIDEYNFPNQPWEQE